MSGTKAGAAKAVATIRERHPGHYQRMGKLGGKVKTPKGFSMMDPVKHRAASVKGGERSRK